MKTLFVLRHAKSSWDNPDWSDYERPLNDRGLRAAHFIGELIAARGLSPRKIISSPARRAEQTAHIVRDAARIAEPIAFDERIYEASPITLYNLVRKFDGRWDSVLLVGHNPGFEELVRVLTGEAVSMPTAALAKINLPVDDWREIKNGKCALEFLIRPKEEMKKLGGDS